MPLKMRPPWISHARERFLERYGIEVTRDDLENIKRLMRRGQSHDCRVLAVWPRGELCAVWFRCRWIPAVYCRRSDKIMTVLPPDELLVSGRADKLKR